MKPSVGQDLPAKLPAWLSGGFSDVLPAPTLIRGPLLSPVHRHALQRSSIAAVCLCRSRLTCTRSEARGPFPGRDLLAPAGWSPPDSTHRSPEATRPGGLLASRRHCDTLRLTAGSAGRPGDPQRAVPYRRWWRFQNPRGRQTVCPGETLQAKTLDAPRCRSRMKICLARLWAGGDPRNGSVSRPCPSCADVPGSPSFFLFLSHGQRYI